MMKKKLPFLKLCCTAMVIIIFSLTIISASAQVSNVQCNSNGTLSNPADDYISFSLQPALPVAVYEDPYTYTVTATQNGNPVTVTLSNGTPAAAVQYFYNYAMPFRLANGTPGNGPIQITVTPDWGNFTPASYVVADPGSCAIVACSGEAGKTLTYTYEHPRVATDIANSAAAIPKFDNTNGRTLIGVSINFTPVMWGGYLYENTGTGSQVYRACAWGDIRFDLAGNPVYSKRDTFYRSAGFPAFLSVASRKYVIASGTWPGDSVRPEILTPYKPADTSTLLAMKWIGNSFFRGFPVLSDSRWVVNASGIANAADDFSVNPIVNFQSTSSVSYTSSNTEFAGFTGTGGNVPLTYTSSSFFSSTGGGGNAKWLSALSGSFKIEVTYTYNDCTGGILPVKLENFSASPKGKAVQVQWKVADMINFSHFEVEHSTSGSNFTKIATVSATPALQYASLHTSPSTGNNFYRLKMVDQDGTYKYSTIIKVDFKKAGSAQVTPNPAIDFVNIQYYAAETGKGMAVWYNATGQQVASQQLVQGNNSNIDIRMLKPGMYMLHITDAKGNKISTEKVLVQ